MGLAQTDPEADCAGTPPAWRVTAPRRQYQAPQGLYADGYRLRVGDYRVLYQVQEAHLVVLVVKVVHRREAYRER